MGYWYLPRIEVGRAVINLEVFSGEVAAVKTWTETRVSSSGGGGAVIQGTGFVSSATVSSNVTRHDELYIRDGEGNERCLRLTNTEVQVRNGSRVSTVLGLPEGQKNGWYVGIYNHDTRAWISFSDGLKRLAPASADLWPVLLGIGGILSTRVPWVGSAGWLAVVVAVVWFSVKGARTRDDMQRQLRAALSQLNG